MYRPSDQSVTLAQYLVDVDARVSGVHETMRDETRVACENHNAALNLMMGAEPYAADWTPLQTDAGGAVVTGDPGPFAPLVDDVTIALKGLDPWSRPNAEQLHDRVLRIAQMDPAHPVAKHHAVLARRCGQPDGWADVAALVG